MLSLLLYLLKYFDMKTCRLNAPFAIAVAMLTFLACSTDEDDSSSQSKSVPYYTLESGNENMPTGGIISVDYSDSPDGSDISKLVDNDYSTSFMTYHTDFYIVWSGNSSATVVSYSLVSAEDSSDYDPTSWIFYGSSDNSNWTILDNQSGVSFSQRGELLTYELDNSKAYKYYRIRIRSSNGGVATRIAEWYLNTESEVVEVDDIRDALSRYSAYMSGSTYSSSTPMGTHFEGLKEASASELAWLAKASENPPVEASGLSEDSYKWTAVDVNLYPYTDPMLADVNQHSIGDCCLCAVLGAFAYMHPDFIKSIISSSGTTFSVKMYNPDGEAITVAVNNEVICDGSGNIAAVSGKNNTATWSTILEKAVMKWEYVYEQSYPLGGIGTEVVAPLFTGDGDSFAFSANVLTASQLADVATTGLGLGYFLVGGFSENGVVVDDPFMSVSGHAFTILAPQTSSALFAMRNPWGFASGSSDGTEDGVMNIYNDGIVPQLVDFRICYPGVASQYPHSAGTYTPPSYSVARSFWLSAQLREYYGLK